MEKPQHEASYAEPEPGAGSAMALGLALFGFAIGFTTAISSHEGISSQLLSGLFSFVDGSVLTYGGFRYVRRNAGAVGAVLSPVRVGLGLAGFSIGVVLGQPAGIAYSSREGGRLASTELNACVERARRGPLEHRQGLEAACYGIRTSAASPSLPVASAAPAVTNPNDSQVSDQWVEFMPRVTNRARGLAADLGSKPKPAKLQVVDPVVPPRATTHGSGDRSTGDRDECLRIQKRLEPGGHWAVEQGALADALRLFVRAVDCDRL